ncbi:HAD-like domain-containing protein [Aspergillus cavernicola]|uniref:HAD-like domain-containing protein n=1 Tax=Aspergillus cavernicola TaxID=176166 RepID=A0ABR4IJM9_9EURO
MTPIHSAKHALTRTMNRYKSHPSPYKLVILDFDGTLFDTLDAITECFKLTFAALLKDYIPEEAQMHRLIANGAPLKDTLRQLQPLDSRTDAFDGDVWVKKYRELYGTCGMELQKPYPYARELLALLKEKGIPAAIVSNKPVSHLQEAMRRHDMLDLVREDFIIGDPLYKDRKKPDGMGFFQVLVPRLKEAFGRDWLIRNGSVLMVGDTVTDIEFARNIGALVCWCRFGRGNKMACEGMQPEFFVDELWDVRDVVVVSK